MSAAPTLGKTFTSMLGGFIWVVGMLSVEEGKNRGHNEVGKLIASTERVFK